MTSPTPQTARDSDTVAVVFADQLPLLELAIPGRVLGLDLGSAGPPPHRVLPVGLNRRPVTTTDGVQLRLPFGLEGLDRAGVLIVPTWYPPDSAPTPPRRLLAALRRAHADGATVVGLCLGAFVLGAAGLLDGRRAATHWAYADALARAYPAAQVDGAALYVDDGTVLTSAGSAAALDACLHLVRRRHGAHAAGAVARALVVAPHRTGDQAQFVTTPVPPATGTDLLGEVITYALEHLHRSLPIPDLASRARMSRRSFDRQFTARTGSPPLRWLTTQRVLLAQRLLESTVLPVDAVARRAGFAGAVSLRPHFRHQVGVPPRNYRATFAEPRPETSRPL